MLPLYMDTQKSMFSDENLDGKAVADAISEETAFSAIIPVLNILGFQLINLIIKCYFLTWA